MVSGSKRSALITGGTGYIGSTLADFLGRGADLTRVLAWGRAELDVTDHDAVRAAVREQAPDVIFHCAAKADTDWCEDHFEAARRVNVGGTVNVVEEGLAADCRVVYFSSACLYPDNDRPYAETDPLAAFCGYTRTKLEAERALKPYADRILNVRMRQPFSNHRHPRNLLHKLASYTDFIDEPNSMSHLEECLPVVWELSCRGETGPFNLTNPGHTTPLRIARMIKERWNPGMTVRRIDYGELLERVDAVRVNALVDCTRLESRGFELEPVEKAVLDCLENRCEVGEYDWTRSMP